MPAANQDAMMRRMIVATMMIADVDAADANADAASDAAAAGANADAFADAAVVQNIVRCLLQIKMR
jgi:hypothetical protein